MARQRAPRATAPKAPKAETYTVIVPPAGGHVGTMTQHGVIFDAGVAHGVAPGMALDDFRDWGYEVIPEFASAILAEPEPEPEPDVDDVATVAEESVDAAVDAVTDAIVDAVTDVPQV